jgi:predicted alpha-1,2-mannosidase
MRGPPAGRIAGAVTAVLLIAVARAAASDPARDVNPFAGTAARAPDFGTGGGAGNTFPGAVAPFGMLAWSPDTDPGDVNVGGGYSFADGRIRGFSLTHLSGAGCAEFEDVPILPVAGALEASPAIRGSFDVRAGLVPSFVHEHEEAEPGYYAVRLEPDTPDAIDVALAARTRSAVGRFVFPPSPHGTVLFNAGGSAMANDDAAFAIDPGAMEISGSVTSGQFCYQRNRYTVHFVARFDRPFAAWGTWRDDALAPGSTSVAQHTDAPFQLRFIPGLTGFAHTTNVTQTGAYVTFDTAAEPAVGVRVAVSFTDVDGARRNLAAESPDFDLDRARAETRAAWNALLRRIDVRGGPEHLRRTFRTMLYHALLAPSVFSDVDGAYRGMDGAAHTVGRRTKYANFSGWDVYRGAVQLLALLVPARASDMAQSLVLDARESGWLPKWPVANGQTDVMVGDPAAPIVASVHAFGARRFDRRAALAALVKGATESGRSPNAGYVERQGLDGYLTRGWVAHDGTENSFGGTTSVFGDTRRVWASAATTLEYAVADFAIARLARALGERELAATFRRRSGSWRNLWNPASGWLEPRYASGAFPPAFDPLSLEGWAEGNAAQYTWMVPFDPAGLFALMGGRAAARARLDRHLERLNEGPESAYAFLGNEPELGVPWLHDWLGEPWKTQAVVRAALLGLFDDGAAGYVGNDDLGTMSAWYVFAALGFYPAVPGVDLLALGSPLFRSATLHLAHGHVLIRAHGVGPSSPYVQRLDIDGRRHDRAWLRFGRIARGGRLDFRLGRRPAKRWGTGRPPPSFPAEVP